mmetsp:Transcript_113034/g.258945  ORF Transcript_113034/g.258945 Transcript_113034/m.258945 type:complete len:355 (+) Transcript_113034:41-1105(+)
MGVCNSRDEYRQGLGVSSISWAMGCNSRDDFRFGDFDVEAECMVRCQNQHGDSPVWCKKTQRLFWLDVQKREVWCLEPMENVAFGRRVGMGSNGGGLLLRGQGGFAVCSSSGVGLLPDCELGESEDVLDPAVVCHPVKDMFDTRSVWLCSGRVDENGRILVSTRSLCDSKSDASTGGEDSDGEAPVTAGKGVFRVTFDPESGDHAHQFLSDLGKDCSAAGIAVSDGGELFFVDARERRVRSFEYGDAVGEERECGTSRMHSGLVHGGCVDAEGGYWAAEYGSGRVVRVMNGVVDRVVRVTAPHVTGCTFGGAGLSVLYITTASGKDPDPSELSGGLFAARIPGVKGAQEHYYSG